MSNVLYLYGKSFQNMSEYAIYDFIFRKLSSDRFDERYEVLKNRYNGKTGHIMLKPEIEIFLEDK